MEVPIREAFLRPIGPEHRAAGGSSERIRCRKAYGASLPVEERMTQKAMTKEAAARIQSAADKSGTNPDFKARAMSTAAKTKK